jgi:hypothetical protein
MFGFGFKPYRLKLLAFSLPRRPGAPILGTQSACDIFLNLSGVWKENQAGNAHLIK